jgi:hypothetical protein
MLVSVFGDPSQNSMFGLRAIQALTEAACGSFNLVCVGTAEDLSAAFRQASKKHIVFFADCLDNHISSLYLESGAPLVIFINDPYAIASSLQLSRSLDPITSVRVTSQSLSCLHDLALAPRAYVVYDQFSIANIDKHVTRFGSEYGIRIDDGITKIIRNILIREIENENKFVRENTQINLTKSHLDLGNDKGSELFTCLEGFRALRSRRPVDSMSWPREVFMDAGGQGALLQEPLDLTGAARLILYGPYLHLPKGDWIATPLFAVSQNLSGNVLKIDIYCDGVIGEWKCQMPSNGIYSFDLSFKISEPRHPVQIRFYITQGAIEGTFDLKHVKLRRA